MTMSFMLEMRHALNTMSSNFSAKGMLPTRGEPKPYMKISGRGTCKTALTQFERLPPFGATACAANVTAHAHAHCLHRSGVVALQWHCVSFMVRGLGLTHEPGAVRARW